MQIFKKTFFIWLISLSVLSLSASIKPINEKTYQQKSGNFYQVSDKPQKTASLDNPNQSKAPEKKQKNNQPTKTPKPTATPPVIPPPADPGASNAMVGLALVSVIVILFGFWLNRQRVF